jgi:hypothetical protein
VLTGLAAAVWGIQPFEEFVHREVPGILDGSAFPQSERPSVAVSNQSVYGLTVRLRLLGASGLEQSLGLKIASLYGLILLALTVLAGLKARIDLSHPAGRLLLVQTGLALLSLASFRSPFVGGPYGTVATLWLLALLAAGSQSLKSAALWSLSLLVCAAVTSLVPSPTYPPTTFWLIVSAGIFVFALGVNTWCVVRLLPSRTEQ